jgi:DNA-binding NarL/FixJ family response regulator
VRVLLLDDARVRDRLRERLEEASAEICVGLDGGGQDEGFDFVVLDVHAPDMGLTGLGQLRQRMPHAVFIVLTNEATELHRRKCLTGGADFFFDKSREFDRAIEVILLSAVARGGASRV